MLLAQIEAELHTEHGPSILMREKASVNPLSKNHVGASGESTFGELRVGQQSIQTPVACLFLKNGFRKFAYAYRVLKGSSVVDAVRPKRLVIEMHDLYWFAYHRQIERSDPA